MSTSTLTYDVIVIGAGPAGYASAIRCAQLGLKTACIDSGCNSDGKPNPGGAFLNTGCVASMALLESAKIYQTLTQEAQDHGIHVGNISIDMAQLMARKNRIINDLGRHITDLFKRWDVSFIHAKARLLNVGLVEIAPVDKSPVYQIETGNVILATGSSPVTLPCAQVDNELIIDADNALSLTEIPKRLAFIGAGFRALEIASIWNRLGSDVILLEAQENFLTLLDEQISQAAFEIFSQQGLKLHTGARVLSARAGQGQVTLEFEDKDGTHTLIVDKLVVASGRKPGSDNLTVAEVNLLLDESGYVHVDENCRTNLPGVYAIGDLTLSGPMLAHKGMEEGVFVAEQIAGLHNPINYHLLPSVVYTEPEIAWTGQTEQALRAMGESYKVSLFPFSACARAHTSGNSQGFIKIIAHAHNDSILGVHIIGAHASELIAEAVLAMEFSASSEDLARTIHAHPTLSEGLHEAAILFKDNALHLP